jgi:DNA-binding transcriptional LysR family regulator
VTLQLFAAPSYLARRSTPRALADLAHHDVIALAAGKTAHPGHVRIVADDKFFARAVLRAGAGIALLPTYLVADDVADGHLVRVVPSFQLSTGTVHLVLPSKKHEPARVAAFRDLLVEMLTARPLNMTASRPA